MERLGHAVQAELRRFGPQGAMPAIVAAWPAAVGSEVARHAWPARIGRDRTLYVHTSSSAWAFELTQLGATVLEQLREALGHEAPRSLRFAPGPLPEPLAEVPSVADPERLRATPETLAEGAAIASAIEDEELRKRVAKAAALSLQSARDDRRF
jgi:hypothetical protein